MLIDASVHPSVATSDDLRDFMDMPWKKRTFSPIHRYSYSNPLDEYYGPAYSGRGVPGSDVALTQEHLFEELGVDIAILLPLTRGLNMDTEVTSAVCAATNRWLTTTWLGEHNSGGRFKGTIRVNPGDPSAAVEEIERWSDHPHLVQVGVPMSALAPYGNRQYWPVWEAAAKAGLPVAVHRDGGSGVEFYPSPVGPFRHHVEYSVFVGFTFIYHLASLITHGVFEAFPESVFVFADGGIDLVMPMIWRMIADYRSNTDDHPWVRESPESYLPDHVRFVYSRMEGPLGETKWARWIELTRASELLMYGSDYPHWSFAPPSTIPADGEAHERILAGNALATYKRLSREGTPLQMEGQTS